MTELQSVIDTLDQAADSFDSIATAEQKKIYDEVITLAKDLDLDAQGKVRQSIANLKRLTEIKARLAALSKDKEWVAGISGFAKYFGILQQQQNAYFSDHFPSHTLTKSAKEKHALMKQLAVQNTMEALMGSGLKANVTDKLNDILLRAVTTNARFADLQEELRTHLLGKDGSQGAFSRYATTYATTALSQFTGQNNKLLTDDLDCEWFMYTGSNKETTREFCRELTAKKFIHRSEIPTILTGRIDDYQCAIYDKTGLPYGMIEGTTADNFQCNCGGWNCRHQLVPVADAVVPAALRAKFAKPKPQEESLWDKLYQQQKGKFDLIIKWATVYGVDTTPAYNKTIGSEKEFNNTLTRIDRETRKKLKEYIQLYDAVAAAANQAKGTGILPDETYSHIHDYDQNKIGTNAEYVSNKSALESLLQKIQDGLNQLANSGKPYIPNLTQEEQTAISKNNTKIEKLLGITKGAPKSIESADKQSTNPNYIPEYIPDPNGRYVDRRTKEKYSVNPNYTQNDKPYTINCATCAAAYILRLRGWDITAKGRIDGSNSLNDQLAYGKSFDIWKNADGTKAIPSTYKDFMQRKGYKQMTPNRYKKFFEEACSTDGIYIVRIGWANGGGHATIIQRENGNLYYIEPQAYTQSKGVRLSIEELCKQGEHIIYGNRGVMRIDNKIFDENWIGLFNK